MKNGSVVSILVAGALFLAGVESAAQPGKAPAPDPNAPPAKAPNAPNAADKPPAKGAAPARRGAGRAPAAAEPAPAQAPADEETDEATEGEAAAPGQNEAPEPAPRTAPAAPEAGAAPGAGTFNPMPLWSQAGTDAAAGERREQHAKEENKNKAGEEQIFAEDWWSHARPALELHGYFRVRAELFHNFSLGRINLPNDQIWPMPADNHYAGANTATSGPALCTSSESPEGGGTSGNANFPCKNKTQAGANMRFRLNPEIHISDNLRVMSQIDLLDNLVLGSTPGGYGNEPSSGGGYAVRPRSGYAPFGALDGTQEPPSAGINSLRDSIRVKRAWAEYMTPVGELRFGRMPEHWGLGMMLNSGDGYDHDYQTTVDRIMFTTAIKPLDLYFAGAWDFVNEGPTSDSLALPQGQPYDVAQLDDVNQYTLIIARKKNPELARLTLARGGLVVNGGLHLTYRKQTLASDGTGPCSEGGAALDCTPAQRAEGFVRRNAKAWIPDLWFQLRYKKFRFELEAAAIRGSFQSSNTDPSNTNVVEAPNGGDWKIRQYGVAAELEQRLVEDKLKLQFKTGWASGDSSVGGGTTGGGTGSSNGLSPGLNGLQPQLGDNTISTFRFHPSYQIDLILNRNILNRIQGVYYLRPSVDYDFMRNVNGQRLGGSFAGIWTRASEFVQTPGHKRDLGIELDLSLYFQSKDGALNDRPDHMGGFFTMLQYGVLFPLGGLGYPSQTSAELERDLGKSASNTSAAQVLRWYMGVFF